MSDNGFDYNLMVEDAMRGVVREALDRAAAAGLPGNHHFYISFHTGAEGVVIPSRLKAQYPDEMTIVIQHQYWNLVVTDWSFEIELSFGGKRERLVIPYTALSGFVDPEAQFGLRFGADGVAGTESDAAAAPPAATGATAPPEADTAKPGEKIVSLDSFRKK